MCLLPNAALNGGAGKDTLEGGEGDDRLRDDGGDNVQRGGAGSDSLRAGAGDDLLTDDEAADPLPGNDTLQGGGGGADTLQSYGGTDALDGGEGMDLLVLVRSAAIANLSLSAADPAATAPLVGDGTTVTGIERFDLTLGAGRDAVALGAGDEVVSGGGGVDALDGGAGNDTLLGGAGLDELTGGAGADAFRFLAPLAKRDRDTIEDFDPALDRIEVSAAGFGGGLTEGMDLGAAGRFVASATGAATAAFAQLCYVTALGELYWDANGTAAGGRTLIAAVAGLPVLDASDIAVVA